MKVLRLPTSNTNATRRFASASLATVLLAGSLTTASLAAAAPAPGTPTPLVPAAPAATAAPAASAAPASKAPAADSALDSNRVIERARKWTDAKVPYSQSGYRGGYRRDCSGFVSMAWDLPDNLITWNLPLVAKRIGKGDLRAGDILLNSRGGAGGRHVVIFEKWADAAKTKYVALEQSGGVDRAIRHVIPYPYEFDKNLYKPYRYAGMAAYDREIPKNQRQTVAGWEARKAAERAATARTLAAAAASSTAAAAAEASAAAHAKDGTLVASADAGLIDRLLGWLGLS